MDIKTRQHPTTEKDRGVVAPYTPPVGAHRVIPAKHKFAEGDGAEAYKVDCPVCEAPAGCWCLLPLGRMMDRPHDQRAKLAEQK